MSDPCEKWLPDDVLVRLANEADTAEDAVTICSCELALLVDEVRAHRAFFVATKQPTRDLNAARRALISAGTPEWMKGKQAEYAAEPGPTTERNVQA